MRQRSLAMLPGELIHIFLPHLIHRLRRIKSLPPNNDATFAPLHDLHRIRFRRELQLVGHHFDTQARAFAEVQPVPHKFRDHDAASLANGNGSAHATFCHKT